MEEFETKKFRKAADRLADEDRTRFLEFLKQARQKLRQIRRKYDDDQGVCHACGSFYHDKLRELTGNYCVECYSEIEFGVIPQESVHIGYGNPYFIEEDCSSWQDNAKKTLEDIE